MAVWPAPWKGITVGAREVQNVAADFFSRVALANPIFQQTAFGWNNNHPPNSPGLSEGLGVYFGPVKGSHFFDALCKLENVGPDMQGVDLSEGSSRHVGQCGTVPNPLPSMWKQAAGPKLHVRCPRCTVVLPGDDPAWRPGPAEGQGGLTTATPRKLFPFRAELAIAKPIAGSAPNFVSCENCP